MSAKVGGVESTRKQTNDVFRMPSEIRDVVSTVQQAHDIRKISECMIEVALHENEIPAEAIPDYITFLFARELYCQR